MRHLQDAKAVGCSINASFYSYCSVVASSIQALYLHSTDGNLRQDAMVCIQLNLVTLEELLGDFGRISLAPLSGYAPKALRTRTALLRIRSGLLSERKAA